MPIVSTYLSPFNPRQNRYFLVPDTELQRIPELASLTGLFPTHGNETNMRKGAAIEYCTQAIRFPLEKRANTLIHLAARRLVFAPLSWTGTSLDETIPLPPKDQDRLKTANMPPYTWTVPLSRLHVPLWYVLPLGSRSCV
ncbi:hypothetical protein EJ06DRAFT_570712 [Trichodelitschia bisporula]|uniref:Uncharacterized protein n=1 Tax=Trichodelitschia bisporula TaxID=703511 RepID=A0A6G1HJ24_9PEZI|nr:hypothetical protein EJ06DRAFT_570712 [Trichodelitschia bisporula]